MIDTDKFGRPTASPVVEAFHATIKDLVRKKLAESGGNWDSFVFHKAYDLITADDMKTVEKRLLDAGHRFDWSAMISVTERPEAYKAAEGMEADMADFSFEHPDAPHAPADAQGRELVGCGDNVVSHAENTVGVARYVRSTDMVLKYLTDGAPPETIAIIDDSGGTLTAPILEQFKGVICAGGTVRSHLGILTREYNIPCLMNAKVAKIKDGDRVEIETSAPAKTADDYAENREVTGNVWRLTK
jgi:phosphohistidine swiveling domain-containing protein